MRKKIQNDVFDIANRLKQVNKNYNIFYNTVKHLYEVELNGAFIHIPYKNLDVKTINKILKLQSPKKIIENIESHNKKLDDYYASELKYAAANRFKEIYSYANNSSVEFNEVKAYKNKWM